MKNNQKESTKNTKTANCGKNCSDKPGKAKKTEKESDKD